MYHSANFGCIGWANKITPYLKLDLKWLNFIQTLGYSARVIYCLINIHEIKFEIDFVISLK